MRNEKRTAADFRTWADQGEDGRARLLAWLAWDDPNGCYSDEAAKLEGFEPLTVEDALAMAIDQLRDGYHGNAPDCGCCPMPHRCTATVPGRPLHQDCPNDATTTIDGALVCDECAETLREL